MREPLLKDIKTLEALLETAHEEPVGERLASLLRELPRRCYAPATVTSSKCLLGRPEPYVLPDGRQSVRLKEMDPARRTFTGPRHDIDGLEETIENPSEGFNGGQLRWDAVCAIKNVISYNCNEIEGL